MSGRLRKKLEIFLHLYTKVHSMGPCKKSEMLDTEKWMKTMHDEIDREGIKQRIANVKN